MIGPKDTLEFLSLLEKNNDRIWFSEHKAEFDLLREKWLEDIQYIIDKVAAFDSSILGLQAKDCVYRIYRDIRFSPNKLPYKNHFAAVISAGGRKATNACYYIHLQPGNNSGICGGVWCPETKVLNKLRHAINDNIEEFEEIINRKGIVDFYNFVGDSLKTGPKGFDKNIPHIDLLRRKDYTLWHDLSDKYFADSNWKDQIVAVLQPLLEFNNFLNYSIEEEI